MALLEIRDLRAGYGEADVLRDVSLSIEHREIVALVGSNGAGKTTLLRTLSGMLGARGSIRLDGAEILGLSSDAVFARGVVQVPEGRQLFDRMTVEDNLRMGAFRRSSRADVQRDLERVFELFPVLAQRRRQLASSMSGGEQQMAALARGLMADPRLLAVDEMSLGLAPVIVERLLGVLSDIRERGVTVLLVEQDVNSALAVADRAYVLEQGAVTLDGPAAVLRDDPRVREAYLGL